MLLLGPLSNIYRLGDLHPQEAPTPSRARMRPSSVPTPKGRSTNTRAGGVFPIRIHVCCVRLENPASGGESSSHPRASHRPFVGAIRLPIKQTSGKESKLSHSLVANLLMLLNCNSSRYEKRCIAMRRYEKHCIAMGRHEKHCIAMAGYEKHGHSDGRQREALYTDYRVCESRHGDDRV